MTMTLDEIATAYNASDAELVAMMTPYRPVHLVRVPFDHFDD